MDAKQTALIEEHLALVTHIVVQQCLEFPAHVDREELIRAGTLGLVEAARRYQPERGMTFARFAGFRIRGAVIDALRTQDWAPRSVRRGARKLEATRVALTAQLNRAPSTEELAAEMGIGPEDVASLEGHARRGSVLSLDRPQSDEDGDTGGLRDSISDDDWIEPVEMLEDRELHGYLRDAVRLLPERHRIVIVGYFFENRTSEQLAALLGVSESRISQLRGEAFLLLRAAIAAQYEPAAEVAGGTSRSVRRRAEYAHAVAELRPWRERLDDDDRVLATAV